MKKYMLYLLALIICSSINVQVAFALETDFTRAIGTCSNYSQDGSIRYKNEIFNLLITLDKARNGSCTYKEKIYQGKDYQMLTCEFEEAHLPFIKDSMERFSEEFKDELQKNKIFEAKLTTNGEVFQKYLVNPRYCKITHSKK